MNQQLTNNNVLEPTTRALHQLSPQSQETVIALVRQLAEREGISVAPTSAPGLQAAPARPCAGVAPPGAPRQEMGPA